MPAHEPLNSMLSKRWWMFVAPALLVLGLGCNQPPPPGSDEGETDTDTGMPGDGDGEPTTTGDGDGEPGDGDPTTTGDGDPTTTGDGGNAFDDTLYPLTDGATWTYVKKNTNGQVLGIEVVAIDEIEWNGVQAWLQSDSPNADGEWTQSVLRRDDDVVYRIHKDIVDQGGTLSIVDYDPGFARVDDAWDTVGYMQEFLYDRTETDGNGLNPDLEPRGHVFTILAVDESVTVAAGTFDCIQVERVRSVGANAGERVLFWFALGVGKVREERPAESTVEELASVSIPGGVALP